MVVPYGIKLAVNLISTHFGDLVTKVCECLLRKGTLTLPEIVRFTELPPQQVKNCLLVLIQHNCVQPFTFENKDGNEDGPKGTHYTTIFEHILHRLRFPKFLAIVSEELDRECVELLEGLLQHGRLTLEQIILRAISKRNEGDVAVQDALRANFVKLVNAHYVERCPDSEPTLKSQSEEKNSSTGKRSAKSAKFVQKQTVEQQAMTDAVRSDRFLVLTNTGTDATSEANTAGKPPNLTTGEKRKIEALEMDEGTKAMICEKEVLWRANFEEFVCHLRHKACVANERSRLDAGAGIVLNAMLEATRRAEKKVKIETSVPLSTDAIFEEVIKSEEGRSMTLEHIRVALSQLGCHCTTRGMEESFSVDLNNIVEIAQNDEVELLVLKRYGRDAYRMFRLLSKTGKLAETDKISDTALVEKKDALKILYGLWKDGYLHMEKIVYGSGHSQSLLWKVNKSLVREHVFDEMCHAALNLKQRLAYELEQGREVIQLPKDKRVGANGKRFERIRKVNVLLNSSLMKLDDALMLFHDF